MQIEKLAMFQRHKTCKTYYMDIHKDVTSGFRVLENNNLHPLRALIIIFKMYTMFDIHPLATNIEKFN